MGETGDVWTVYRFKHANGRWLDWHATKDGEWTPPPDAETVRVVPAESLAAERRAREQAEAERDALEEALTAIRDHGSSEQFPCHALAKGDCEDVMREIARSVLSRV